jgi:hypothetical protein
MVVVPLDAQPDDVAQHFFEMTYGRIASNSQNAERIFYAFLAVSAFGNIVVMTYTAARVKQEIAKEGILPFPKFWAQNIDVSLGRVLRWLQGHSSRSWVHRMLKKRWLSPDEHSEKTPVGALILHLLSCVVLIFATYGLTPDNAYTLLSGLTIYVISGIFGSLLGLGILILRLTPSYDWKTKSHQFNHGLSIACGFVFLIGNLFPVIVKWVPESNTTTPTTPGEQVLGWFVVPTISWIIVGVGALWYLGFLFIAKRKEKSKGVIFTVQKVPFFERDPPITGPPFQDHETVYLAWTGEKDFGSSLVDDDFATTDTPARNFHSPAPAPVDDFGGRGGWSNQVQSDFGAHNRWNNQVNSDFSSHGSWSNPVPSDSGGQGGWSSQVNSDFAGGRAL